MSQCQRDTLIHLVAGGTAGTVGAVLTCPLEVVKTRLQSSTSFLGPRNTISPPLTTPRIHRSPIGETNTTHTPSSPRPRRFSNFTSNNYNNSNSNGSNFNTTLPSGCSNGRSGTPKSAHPHPSVSLRSPFGCPEAFIRHEQRRKLSTTLLRNRSQPQVIGGLRRVMAISHFGISSNPPKSMSIVQCLRHIVQNEGPRALFKGLGPNLVGVAPSRAIYFCTYSQTKGFLNDIGMIEPNSTQVHIMSAASAGFVSSSITNPIWFVKTRLQLDYNSKIQMTVKECIARVYSQGGLPAFYKGISASYFGICETVVHFVIYESIKKRLIERQNERKTETKSTRDFLEFMLAGAISKTVASCMAYPHEVARTRLREEGDKYNTFFQTLRTVWREEGRAGLYRGLATQLIRQIPNTAIMMATYEAVVYVLTRRFNNKNNEFYDF